MSSMAYRALVPCLLASDIAWILELYFKHPVSDNIPYLYQKGYLCYFLLGHALSRFVGQEAEEAIELLLLASESEDNAYHIRVLSEVHKSQRTRVRKALIDNPNVPNKQVVKDWFRLRGSETFRFKT